MRSTGLAAAGILATALLATAQTASDDSPYIPASGISAQCHDYLVALDSNSQLASCSNALLDATSLFSPTATTSSSTVSAAQIASALGKLCSSSSQCSASVIKDALTDFSGNCSAELTAGNQLVKSNYDVLYVLRPFTQAVCTKDTTTNQYCALEIGDASSASSANSTNGGSSNSTSSPTAFIAQMPHLQMSDLYVTLSHVAKRAVSKLTKRNSLFGNGHDGSSAHHHQHQRRQASTASTTTTSSTDGAALLPNATTFQSSNLPFLFLSGDMTSAQLCTPCTKSVLASYVAFENAYPYSIGLTNSPILGGQLTLWKDIGKVCGSGFLSAITSQSGSTISSGALHNAAASGLAAGAALIAALLVL